MLLENHSVSAEVNMDETSTDNSTGQPPEQQQHNSQELTSQQQTVNFPFNDRVSSAAAAMLSLSASLPPGFRGEMDVKSEPGTPVSSAASDGHLYDQDGFVRRERAFVPEMRKDDQYWVKRRKNNEAAKKSREKRRAQDKVLSQTVSQLNDVVDELKEELEEMKHYYGYPTTVKFDPALVECLPIHRQKRPVVIEPESPPRETHCVPSIPTQNETLMTPLNSAISIPVPKTPLPETPVMLPPGIPMPREAGVPLVLVPNAFANLGVSPSPPQPHYNPQSMDIRRTSTTDQFASVRSVLQHEADDNDLSLKRRRMSLENQGYDRRVVPKHVENLETESLSDGPGSSYSKYYSQDYTEDNFRAQERKGIPYKLRHKYSSISLSCTSDSDAATRDLPSNSFNVEQDAPLNMVLGDDCNTSSNFSDDSDSGSTSCSASQNGGISYLQRRRRNNEASRKCRKNKRVVEMKQQELADDLEDENHKLRSEMQYLSGEIEYLKELFRHKSDVERRGERFEPSVHVLDRLDQRGNARL